MKPVAYTYHADIYCADCGANLPDVDPEGNDKGVVFAGAEFDAIPYCGACHQPLDDFTLTAHGVIHTIDYLAECAVSLGVSADEDTLDNALYHIRHYEDALTIGERALVEALLAGDEGAAYAIAKYYRAVNGDDLHHIPAPVREYWPY